MWPSCIDPCCECDLHVVLVAKGFFYLYFYKSKVYNIPYKISMVMIFLSPSDVGHNCIVVKLLLSDACVCLPLR